MAKEVKSPGELVLDEVVRSPEVFHIGEFKGKVISDIIKIRHNFDKLKNEKNVEDCVSYISNLLSAFTDLKTALSPSKVYEKSVKKKIDLIYKNLSTLMVMVNNISFEERLKKDSGEIAKAEIYRAGLIKQFNELDNPFFIPLREGLGRVGEQSFVKRWLDKLKR